MLEGNSLNSRPDSKSLEKLPLERNKIRYMNNKTYTFWTQFGTVFYVGQQGNRIATIQHTCQMNKKKS